MCKPRLSTQLIPIRKSTQTRSTSVSGQISITSFTTSTILHLSKLNVELTLIQSTQETSTDIHHCVDTTTTIVPHVNSLKTCSQQITSYLCRMRQRPTLYHRSIGTMSIPDLNLVGPTCRHREQNTSTLFREISD